MSEIGFWDTVPIPVLGALAACLWKVCSRPNPPIVEDFSIGAEMLCAAAITAFGTLLSHYATTPDPADGGFRDFSLRWNALAAVLITFVAAGGAAATYAWGYVASPEGAWEMTPRSALLVSVGGGALLYLAWVAARLGVVAYGVPFFRSLLL